jgi:hypothetical protein
MINRLSIDENEKSKRRDERDFASGVNGRARQIAGVRRASRGGGRGEGQDGGRALRVVDAIEGRDGEVPVGLVRVGVVRHHRVKPRLRCS